MIRQMIRPAARAMPFMPPSSVTLSRRSVMTLSKQVYTAKAQSSGQGRNGKVSLRSEGPFELDLAMPKDLGGSGKGHNPEQLFAMGYSACFLSALNLGASKNKIELPPNVKCEADVHIGPPTEGPPFAIAVDLIISSDATDDASKERLQKAVDIAHGICPYSTATRNNIEVKLTVK